MRLKQKPVQIFDKETMKAEMERQELQHQQSLNEDPKDAVVTIQTKPRPVVKLHGSSNTDQVKALTSQLDSLKQEKSHLSERIATL